MFLTSPAKINLHLAVLQKRSDGFHEIESLFHAISLRDKLWVRPQTKKVFSFSVHPSSTVAAKTASYNLQEDQTFFEIFRQLKKKWNLPFQGIEIILQKNIPIGAGLGGGSSNMAAFLLCLHAYKKFTPISFAKATEKTPHTFTCLSKKEQSLLFAQAAKLGSDVPFFLHGGLSLVSGRGEEVKPLFFFLRNQAVLVFPPQHISSAKAYVNSVTLGRFFSPYSKNVSTNGNKNGYICHALNSLLETSSNSTLFSAKFLQNSMKMTLLNFLMNGDACLRSAAKKNFLLSENKTRNNTSFEVAGNAFFAKTIQQYKHIKNGYSAMELWRKKNNKNTLIHGLSGSGSTLFWVFHDKIANKEGSANFSESSYFVATKAGKPALFERFKVSNVRLGGFCVNARPIKD